MRTVTYNCDLCREKKDRTEVYTMFWKSDILPQRFILTPTKSDNIIDRQICIDCIKEIQQFVLTNNKPKS